MLAIGKQVIHNIIFKVHFEVYTEDCLVNMLSRPQSKDEPT